LGTYPRYIKPGFKPFDPIHLARETEEIVCRGNARKYTGFYATGVYGGIATGYTCGCCLRCVFCWVDWSRDFPERYGQLHSPEEAFRRLRETAHQFNVRKLRISGAEPTLGKEHLLRLLEHVERSEFDLFILETNGMLFGVDRDYVKAVSEFRKAHVRLSLKAGTPEDFARKTGARPEAFEIPFSAIRNLLDFDASFHVAAMSADPRIMSCDERMALVEKLTSINRRLASTLEEEVIDPYETTLARLKHAGLKLEWPLRKTHEPARSLRIDNESRRSNRLKTQR
jgi:uncharacterized Fe-S cluster-containing radical SAM superfamily protein